MINENYITLREKLSFPASVIKCRHQIYIHTWFVCISNSYLANEHRNRQKYLLQMVVPHMSLNGLAGVSDLQATGPCALEYYASQILKGQRSRVIKGCSSTWARLVGETRQTRALLPLSCTFYTTTHEWVNATKKGRHEGTFSVAYYRLISQYQGDRDLLGWTEIFSPGQIFARSNRDLLDRTEICSVGPRRCIVTNIRTAPSHRISR